MGFGPAGHQTQPVLSCPCSRRRRGRVAYRLIHLSGTANPAISTRLRQPGVAAGVCADIPIGAP